MFILNPVCNSWILVGNEDRILDMVVSGKFKLGHQYK